jgi:anthranilate phosphoribosyltransferase
MRKLLHKLVEQIHLSSDESSHAFDLIMSGQVDPVMIAGFLTALQAKGPTVDELVGAARVMREKSTKIDVPPDRVLLDTCGTGGDVKGTFNISTAAAIVVASCGVGVVKHGNRSASGRSGSADVLEALGVKLDMAPHVQLRCLERINLCFAFARSHHPAMKHVAPVRQTLGVPTIFNMLGPLTNPAGATHQLLGVYSQAVGGLMIHALRSLGSARATVACGQDGLDELSTMAPTRLWELRDGSIEQRTFDALDLDIPRASLADLQAASPGESAAMIRRVFDGVPGPACDIVALNAGAGLATIRDDSIEACYREAREAISSGSARQTLERLTNLSQSVDQ